MDTVSVRTVIETDWRDPDIERVGIIPTGIINGKRVFGLVFSKSYKLVTVGGAYENDRDHDLFDTLNREIGEETRNLSPILRVTNGATISLLSTICCICPVTDVEYIVANTNETTVFIWVNEDDFKLLPSKLTRISQEIKYLAQNYHLIDQAIETLTPLDIVVPFPDSMRPPYVSNPVIRMGTYEQALHVASTTQGKYRCFVAGNVLYCVMFSNGSYFFLSEDETIEVMKICKAKDAVFVVPRNFRKIEDFSGELNDAKYFYIDVRSTKGLDMCLEMMAAEKLQFDSAKKRNMKPARDVLDIIGRSSRIVPNSRSSNRFVPYITNGGQHGISGEKKSNIIVPGRTFSSAVSPTESSSSSSSSFASPKKSGYYGFRSPSRSSDSSRSSSSSNSPDSSDFDSSYERYSRKPRDTEYVPRQKSSSKGKYGFISPGPYSNPTGKTSSSTEQPLDYVRKPATQW